MKSKNWVSTALACEALELTPRQLRRLIPALKLGIDYRAIAKPNAARKTYQWHLGNLKQKLKL